MGHIHQSAQNKALNVAATVSMPAVSGTNGDFSRVFLDVVGWNSVVSLTADGKTVSKFHYNASNKLDYIDQYAQNTALNVAATVSMPAVSGTNGDFSRVFLDVVSRSAEGRVGAECRSGW